jgi:hypothetical protein
VGASCPPEPALDSGLLVVFAVGLAATSLLTWLGSYGGKAVVVTLANLAAAAAVNVGLFLLVCFGSHPSTDPDSGTGRWRLGGWGGLAGLAGRRWVSVGHYLRHTSQVYGVFAIVLGLLFWLYLGAQLTLYAVEVNVVAARRLWPRSRLRPPSTNTDQPAPVFNCQGQRSTMEMSHGASLDLPLPWESA